MIFFTLGIGTGTGSLGSGLALEEGSFRSKAVLDSSGKET